MFSRAVALTISSLLLLASATPLEVAGICSNGSDALCCNAVMQASDPAAAGILGLLGVVVPNLNLIVGLTCSPIGTPSTAACSANTVCCANDNFGGLIALDCTPVTL
ncbi:fungal hydrophobin [Pilatotrama ljubarskyi]|nr:fungal hydrophobin [Pilatotrama ljubarskyi]